LFLKRRRLLAGLRIKYQNFVLFCDFLTNFVSSLVTVDESKVNYVNLEINLEINVEILLFEIVSTPSFKILLKFPNEKGVKQDKNLANFH